jgi:trehalose 6-phosphate synthase
MKTLHLRLFALIATIFIAVACLVLPFTDYLTLRWFSRDLSIRDALLTNVLSDSIAQALQDPRKQHLQSLFHRTMQDEHLAAIGLCSVDGRLLWKSSAFPAELTCRSAHLTSALSDPRLRLEDKPVYVGTQVVSDDTGRIADLVLLHDLRFIERRSQETRRYLIFFLAGLGASIVFVTIVVTQLSKRTWISETRELLRSENLLHSRNTPRAELEPLAADLRARLHDLEDEIRRAQKFSSEWKPERLRTLLRTKLRGDQIIVVSNREPYIHEEGADGEIVVKRPASGVVTAIATPTSARWMRATMCRSPPAATSTRYGAYGYRNRKSKATTMVSPTKASGRSVTWRMYVLFFAKAIGSITAT